MSLCVWYFFCNKLFGYCHARLNLITYYPFGSIFSDVFIVSSQFCLDYHLMIDRYIHAVARSITVSLIYLRSFAHLLVEFVFMTHTNSQFYFISLIFEMVFFYVFKCFFFGTKLCVLKIKMYQIIILILKIEYVFFSVLWQYLYSKLA